MATRTLSMSNPFSSTSRRTGFLRRLILLLLFTVGIAIWLNALDRHQVNVPEEGMLIFVNVVTALACGFGSRFVFYRRSWVVRLVAALASLVICQFVLGFLSEWRLGIGPFEFPRKSVDWLEAAQLGGGALIVLIGLFAWWRPRSSTGFGAPLRESRPDYANDYRTSWPPAQPASMAVAPQPRSSYVMPSRPQRRTNGGGGRLKVGGQVRSRTGRSTTSGGKVAVSRPMKQARPKSKRRGLFQRKPDLQISVYEEHRCPFCLEPVKRNDPRGVKECDVCHTLHHGDCWDITGMCQVPHLNS